MPNQVLQWCACSTAGAVLLRATTVANPLPCWMFRLMTTTARVFTISGSPKHAGNSHMRMSPALGGYCSVTKVGLGIRSGRLVGIGLRTAGGAKKKGAAGAAPFPFHTYLSLRFLAFTLRAKGRPSARRINLPDRQWRKHVTKMTT